MKKRIWLALALSVLVFGLQTASAQLPIKIPKIPKPNQPKPDSSTPPTQPASGSEAQPSQPRPPAAAPGEDQPTIAKDSIKVFTANISGSLDAPKDKQLQWKPGISFRVIGPIPGGSQLSVEFGYPGRANWAKFDCHTGETAQGQSLEVDECLAPDRMTTPYVGPVDFSIQLRNELQGTTTTL